MDQHTWDTASLKVPSVFVVTAECITIKSKVIKFWLGAVALCGHS